MKEVSIIIVSLLILLFAGYYFFQSSDFENIERKLTESDLKLSDNFKIVNANDEQTLVDYYTDYEILISEKDKFRLINDIKNSRKFKTVKSEEFDSYWNNEYEKELVNNQTIRNFKINQTYVRTITFPNSSRKLETEIDTINNVLRITDSAD